MKKEMEEFQKAYANAMKHDIDYYSDAVFTENNISLPDWVEVKCHVEGVLINFSFHKSRAIFAEHNFRGDTIMNNYFTYEEKQELHKKVFDAYSRKRLESIDSLYTEDAFMMCKRLEFKNLLGRFDVSAPKINVEEHFKLITSLEEAEKVWDKARNKDVAFSFVDGTNSVSKDNDKEGQLSLFDEPSVNEYAGIAIAYSEEDIYLPTCLS